MAVHDPNSETWGPCDSESELESGTGPSAHVTWGSDLEWRQALPWPAAWQGPATSWLAGPARRDQLLTSDTCKQVKFAIPNFKLIYLYHAETQYTISAGGAVV